MVRSLRVGVLLSRTPIITREPSAFAKAYYNYMNELERRLMWTFPSYFYFKRGTLAQRRFDSLQDGPIPRHKNVYYPQGIPDVMHNRERRLKQDVKLPTASTEDGVDPISRLPRASDTDADITSLGRKLDQTLFLLINNAKNGWKFPSFEVGDDAKSLHEAAEQGITDLGGSNINVWTVSNTPAAVLNKDSTPEFMMKSHVLHGQFVPTQAGLEYAWLTANEVKEKAPALFEQVRYLL